MNAKKGVPKSEPRLLVEIGEKASGWVAMVGLIGDGQEIHTGEEGGLSAWSDAVAQSTAKTKWAVHCPPRVAPKFEVPPSTVHRELDLTYTLRSRRADDLHVWVAKLLEGSSASLTAAATLAARISSSGFPLYLTRNIDDARAYARDYYSGSETSRYGLLCSSQARNLAPRGIDNSWHAKTKDFQRCSLV